MLQPGVDVSGLVYLKEKGTEANTSSAAPNCPRACHDSQTEDRRGKTHQQRVCQITHTTVSAASQQ